MAINPADGYPRTDPIYAVYGGDKKKQASQFILDIDTAMRANYSINIENIGLNIYPMLYAESTFDGGRYTLLVDEHTSYVQQTVSPIYDVVKAISHIPLGIFSIISAYADYPENLQWVPALREFGAQIERVLANYDQYRFPDRLSEEGNVKILKDSLNFIQTIIRGGNFTLDEFSSYARSLTPIIVNNQVIAATDQVEVMRRTLLAWKGKLGDALWDKLYVVVSAIWTLTQENAHELIIKSTMKPELQETHVIVSEEPTNLDQARNLLGRIVGDRVMAELVFNPDGTHEEKEDIYSLSTRRDLLSQAVELVLGIKDVKSLCPHLNS